MIGLARQPMADGSMPTSQRFSPVWRHLPRALVIAFGLPALTGCGIGVFDPHGPVAAANETILLDSVAIMLAIIVPTGIAAMVFAWWFREGNQRARFLPQFTYSGRVELVVWSIPTLVIVFLGGIIWIGSHELDPAKPLPSTKPPLEVQVVSLDWKWLFIYPQQGIASINVLYAPTNQPIHFSITSASVMNVFWVPQLGSMIYAMNGMTTQLNLEASDPGTYQGRSAQFSGDGFPSMQFMVHAVSDADFNNWVNSARSGGGKLDADTYKALTRQSMGLAPQTYGSVEANLFHDIATQVLPPGPGPESGRPNPKVIESGNQVNVR